MKFSNTKAIGPESEASELTFKKTLDMEHPMHKLYHAKCGGDDTNVKFNATQMDFHTSEAHFTARRKSM